MKKLLSTLLLIVMLCQVLPFDAMATVGKVLTDDELARAYALTGLGQHDGLYHNGMMPNASMSGMQLARWLESQLDNQVHTIDDVLARARYQLDVLKERYPAIYRVFVQSAFYDQAAALTEQVEALRMDMTYQLERIKTDINMISEMRSRLLENEGLLFDSERVRASARIEAATDELTGIRDYITLNAADWDKKLKGWTERVQSDGGSAGEEDITASLKRFLSALWKKYAPGGEGADPSVEEALRKLLKEQFAKYAPQGQSADAFADDAIALMHRMWEQYDPDGETGMAIIAELQSLVKRLYEQYGTEGTDDETLIADLEALMHELWQKYGPGSDINKDFTAAWRELLTEYGVDSAAVEDFSDEMNAMLEAMWEKYGPGGESRDAMLTEIRSLLGAIDASIGEGDIGQWISKLFTTESQPASNSAPVKATSMSRSIASRLSNAAGLQPNDVDASVTVITKNEVCLAFVIGENQQRKGVGGVSVRVRDATKPDMPLLQYHSNEDGLVILPSNKFVTNKYDEVHLYIEVDPRQQGYRNYVIEDLDLILGQTFMDVLVPIEEEASGDVVSNAAGDPYVISASFNGKDIMHSEYEMIYSPANKKDFTIKVVMDMASNQNLPDLMMNWYENEGGFKSIKKHWAEATTKKTTAEGYVEYTFKGPWKKRFTPNASDEQRPTFSFGKDTDALSYPSQLVALRSATDEPLNEGTGPEGGVYASVFGKGFGMAFQIPVVDVNASLNVPISKYIPRLSIDPAGFVAMWIGCPVMEDEMDDSALSWESKDMEAFRRTSEFVEKEGWLANYKAQFGLASDFYREKKWKFMGESSIEIGLFAVATGRWELDNDNPDVKCTNIQAAVGFGATACYEYSWTISYPIGPVPAYVCFALGVCAGVSIQFTADFAWTNGSFSGFKLYPIDEITYSISFYFSAQVGVGVKGFLDAYVRFVASLDVMIRMVLFGLDKCSTEVTGGFELSTGLTVFFVKFRKTWITKEYTIFSSVPADNSLLGHYMNAEKNAPKVVEAAHLDPQGYPELASEAKLVISETNAKASFKVINVNNADYAFYLKRVNDKNSKAHWRVFWRKLDSSNLSGSTQTAIDTWQTSLNGYDDYAFDVHESDGLVFLSVACAAKFDANGLPLPNEGIDDRKRCNQIFYLMILQPDSKAGLTHKLSKGYYTRTDKDEDHFLVTAEPVGTYTVQAGTYEAHTMRYYYDSIATPVITWAKVNRRSNKVLGLELFGTFGRVNYMEDEPAYGITSFEAITGNPVRCFNDKYVLSGMGKNYVRTEVRGAMRCSDTEPKLYHRTGNNELNSPSFIALSQPLDGKGDRAIEVFDFEMNAVNDMFGREAVPVAQGDIQHFELTQTAVNGDGTNYRRVIFFTQKEKNDEGLERSRLYGLYLEPVVRETGGITFTVTRYEYDLDIPDGQFRLAYMGETPYIYWISALPDPDQKDKNKWRVWTVAYDMSTNAMTDAAVFAEFQAPYYGTLISRGPFGIDQVILKNTILQDLILMGTGTSYFTIVPDEIPSRYQRDLPSPMALCSLNELLKPVVEMRTAITQAPAVSAGSFEDISMALMNSGNLGVSTFDIAMYEVTNGQEGKKPVETVHVNCVDPEKSKVTMQNGKEELTGKKVARRAEDFDYTARQRDWVLSEEKKEYKVRVFGNGNAVESVRTVDSKTQYVKSEVLMPGSIGVYNTAFLIPESWRGKKTLRFKLQQLSVRSNLSRLWANGESPELLTWVLDEGSNRLVLQRPASANGVVANAIESGMIANATSAASLDLELTVHDLSATHRVYKGWDGQKWLDIIVHNYAAFGDNPKLACAVYVDGASDPYYVNLPYYDQSIANRTTQTISMPLSALVDDPSAHSRARVVVSVVGREDCAFVNNEFTVYLGGSNALRFVTEPEDVTAQEGEDVAFTVEVAGGTKPYTYQWQVFNPKTGEWVDLKGFNQPTLSRKNIEKKWDGCRFRCVVTDAAGTQIISQEVTLTVRDSVDTGDYSNLPLYLAVAIAALIVLWWMKRRRSME